MDKAVQTRGESYGNMMSNPNSNPIAEVPREISRLGDACNITHILLDELEKKLSPLMMSEPPQGTNGQDTAYAIHSTLGADISARALSTESANERLRRITNRLCL